MATPEDHSLRQTLSGWQIFFIVITVVIGSGCFTDFGVAAKTAGPAGLLVAVVLVGVIAVCAMEGLSELTQLFPTVNPIVEIVYEFVDLDLALCVGIAYWYAYSSIVALQIFRASTYLNFYDNSADSGGWLAAKILAFYVVTAGLITIINCFDVKIFGFIESVGGLFKLILLLVVVFMLYFIAGARIDVGQNLQSYRTAFIDRLEGTDVLGSAICAAIGSISFSFLGIECIVMTAFEAKDSINLRLPSQFMAYAALGCYLLLAIATSICLDWQNAPPSIHNLVTDHLGPPNSTTPTSSSSALIVAAEAVKQYKLAGAMNSIFMFCAISGANSALYVSSRMLYGIAYMDLWQGRRWSTVLATVEDNGVPRNAVLVSAASFCLWLPFTQVVSSDAATKLANWFFIAGSTCIFFMWAAISFAYLRYWIAFRRYQSYQKIGEVESSRSHHSNDEVPSQVLRARFGKRRPRKAYSTLLDWAQPVPAVVGLCGSILIVWVFPTAIFWGRSSFTGGQFIENYTMPWLLLVLFLMIKSYRLFWNWKGHRDMFSMTFGEWLRSPNVIEFPKVYQRLSEFSRLSRPDATRAGSFSEQGNSVAGMTEYRDLNQGR